MASVPTLIQTPKLTLLSQSGAGSGLFLAADANLVTKITGILVTSTVNSDVSIEFQMGTKLWTVTIPANAGSDGVTPTYDVLAQCPGLPVDADGIGLVGQRFMYMKAGDTTIDRSIVSMGAGTITYIVIYGLY